MALLFGEEFGGVVAVLVFVDDDVFGRWDKAVLYATISAEAFLVGSCMEESYIEWLVLLQFGDAEGDCERRKLGVFHTGERIH